MTDFIDIDGVKIFHHYEKKISPKQETVVLFHGFRSSFRSFKSIISAKRDYRVIAMDLISHGLSENIDDTSLEIMSKYTNDFLEKIGIKSGEYIAVGHSLGGGVIANLKIKPKKAILIAPFNPFILKYDTKEHIEKLIDPKNLNQAIFSMESLISPESNRKEFFETIEQGARRLLDSTMKKKKYLNYLVHGEILNPQFLKKGEKFYLNLKGIETKIVTGDEDNFVSKKSLTKLSKLIGAELIILDKTGHAPIYERPEKILDIISTLI